MKRIASIYWKDSLSSYYWDVWGHKLVATDSTGGQTGVSQNYGCGCENTETEIGILYNPTSRNVTFFKNSVNQGVAFRNVRSGLYPAFDLWFQNGSIEILPARKPTSKTYL